MTEKEIQNAKVSDEVKNILRSYNHNLDDTLIDDEPDKYIYFGLLSIFLVFCMAILAFFLTFFL